MPVIKGKVWGVEDTVTEGSDEQNHSHNQKQTRPVAVLSVVWNMIFIN